MKRAFLVVGWTLRASAAICIVWVVTQVLGGQLDTLTAILSSVAWHATMALSGVALVGAARTERGSRLAGGSSAVQ